MAPAAASTAGRHQVDHGATTSRDGKPSSEEYTPCAGELAAVTALFREASKSFPNAGPEGDTTSNFAKSRCLSACSLSRCFSYLCFNGSLWDLSEGTLLKKVTSEPLQLHVCETLC